MQSIFVVFIKFYSVFVNFMAFSFRFFVDSFQGSRISLVGLGGWMVADVEIGVFLGLDRVWRWELGWFAVLIRY